MFQEWRRAREEPDELNLIPILNLMVILIPFLLLGAAFYHLGVVPISLPTNVDQASAEPPKEQVVITLNLEILDDKLLLTASSSQLGAEALAGLRTELPKKGQGQDLDGLQARLLELKQAYPKSDTVVVLPAEGVRYQELVSVLDTTRERLLEKTGADGKPIREPLFPVTVFSKKLVPEPDAGLDEEGGAGEAP